MKSKKKAERNYHSLRNNPEERVSHCLVSTLVHANRGAADWVKLPRVSI